MRRAYDHQVAVEVVCSNSVGEGMVDFFVVVSVFAGTVENLHMVILVTSLLLSTPVTNSGCATGAGLGVYRWQSAPSGARTRDLQTKSLENTRVRL